MTDKEANFFDMIFDNIKCHVIHDCRYSDYITVKEVFSPVLLRSLMKLQDECKVPFRIIRGLICRSDEKELFTSATRSHMSGEAVDILSGDNIEVALTAKRIPELKHIRVTPRYLHIDVASYSGLRYSRER